MGLKNAIAAKVAPKATKPAAAVTEKPLRRAVAPKATKPAAPTKPAPVAEKETPAKRSPGRPKGSTKVKAVESNLPEDAAVLATKSGFRIAVMSGPWMAKDGTVTEMVRIARVFEAKDNPEVLMMSAKGISIPKKSLKALLPSFVKTLTALVG